MQCTIERATLLKTLARLQAIVERRNTIAILSNFKLEAKDGTLTLTATDMDLAASESVPANVKSPGATTVPAHTLYDIVRKLSDGSQVDLGIDAKDPARLALRSASAKFHLPTLPAADFPVMAEGNTTHEFTLPTTEFLSLIDKTRFAISTEETRYYLNGIYLHVTGGKQSGDTPMLRSVATDGHRLARIELPAPANAMGMPGIIIPRKTVAELKKLLEESEGDVHVALSESKIRFACGHVVLLSKLIDGIYPDYERVIPANNNKIMEVDTRSFTEAVDRVATICAEKTRSVKMELSDGRMVLSANSPDSGSASEEIPIKYGAGNMEIGFNSRYMLDMMAQLQGESAQFMLSDPFAPALVRDPAEVGAIYVLMPMRI